MTFASLASVTAKPWRVRLPRRAAASFNKPDAANLAMALWLTIEAQQRRVADLER